MDILFLGTGAAVPSRARTTSCIALRSKRGIVLMDCGEGSQRQLMISPFSFMKVNTILITHLHGDHVFGLPCLLQTMAMSGRSAPLSVYGPPGIKGYIDSCMAYTNGELTYDLTVTEVVGGEGFTNDGYMISVYATEHGMVSVGYVVREPDAPGKVDIEKARALGIDDSPLLARIKKGETVNGVEPSDVLTDPVPGLSVSYTGDTLPTQSTIEASGGVDVLIHESTYMQSESENARTHFHSTSIDAANTARDAGVRYLLLTHVSNRYDERSEVQAEARTVFQESYAVDDMYLFEVTRRGLFLKSDGTDIKS